MSRHRGLVSSSRTDGGEWRSNAVSDDIPGCRPNFFFYAYFNYTCPLCPSHPRAQALAHSRFCFQNTRLTIIYPSRTPHDVGSKTVSGRWYSSCPLKAELLTWRSTQEVARRDQRTGLRLQLGLQRHRYFPSSLITHMSSFALHVIYMGTDE